VSGHERCDFSFGSQALQQTENHGAGCGVQISSGLIGEKNFWIVYKSAGDGDALHLSAGKLMRHAVFEAGEFDGGEPIECEPARVRISRKEQGKFNVFDDAERVDSAGRIGKRNRLFRGAVSSVSHRRAN